MDICFDDKMMFQPQRIVCPRCLWSGLIITEDIRDDNRATWIWMTGAASPKARIKCPHCRNTFDLSFEACKSRGDEVLFKCIENPNTGLYMWKNMGSGNPKIPVYRPHARKRTLFERNLDARCALIAAHTVRWKQGAAVGRSLTDILSRLEDYTKCKTWTQFKKHHLVVDVCSTAGSTEMCEGFSGSFETVNNKHQDLKVALKDRLGRDAGMESNQFCQNKIGRCAEVHAANRCLNNVANSNINHLKFSIAYICRTGQPRSYCMNCITLFRLRNG